MSAELRLTIFGHSHSLVPFRTEGGNAPSMPDLHAAGFVEGQAVTLIPTVELVRLRAVETAARLHNYRQHALSCRDDCDLSTDNGAPLPDLGCKDGVRLAALVTK